MFPRNGPLVCGRRSDAPELRDAYNLRSLTEFCAYYTGGFDTNVLRLVLCLIWPGWVVLAVGANIGFWTVPMARALHGCGRLHAFEPVQANFKRLGENILTNGLTGIVELHPVGLSDSEALVWISKREDFGMGSETGNAAIVIDSDDEQFAREEIKIVPLDGRVFESLGIKRLDFIKVDIEGHEDRFLIGASEVIRRFRPIIYMEINEPYYTRRGLDPTKVFDDWMDVNSYKACLLTDAGWKLDQLCHRKPVIDNVFLLPSERVEDLARFIALAQSGHCETDIEASVAAGSPLCLRHTRGVNLATFAAVVTR